MSKTKTKVEAVLFLSGRMLDLDEIRKFCRTNEEAVKEALKELKKEYDEKNSGIKLINDGHKWKFAVEDEYIPIARKIGTETELGKSVLETLAVIAFKYPVLQADVIKIRTNKAYKHLEELEQSGFISRMKHSRTNLIKLTDKFFNYFDLPPEKLKDKFQGFEELAKAIVGKEEEIEEINEKRKEDAENVEEQEEKIKKEIEELDEAGEEYEVPVKVYDSEVKEEDKLGGLEVVETSEEEDDSEVESEVEESDDEEKSDVDEAVDKMMNPEE